MVPATSFHYLFLATTLLLHLAPQVSATTLTLPTYRPFQNNAPYTPPTNSLSTRQLTPDFPTCTNISRQACGHACIDPLARCCDTLIGDFCDAGYYCTLSGCCRDDSYCGDEKAPVCYDASDAVCPGAEGCCEGERPVCVRREDETYVCQANSVKDEEDEEELSVKGGSNVTATTADNGNVITLVTTGPSATNEADVKAASSSAEGGTRIGLWLMGAGSALALGFSML